MNDHVSEMKVRVRRHMLTSLVVALGVPALAIGAGVAFGADAWGGPARLAVMLAIGAAIVAGGVASARFHLRCPKCGIVVSRAVAGWAPRGPCPGCGATLFAR